MRVTLYPADKAGCGFYRMYEPARVTRALGAEVDTREYIQAEFDENNNVKRMAPNHSEVVVMQRCAFAKIAACVPAFQKMGIAVVVDMDDDVGALGPTHPAKAQYDGLEDEHPEIHWKNLARACSEADLVTATTPALLERYAQHGRGALLPNCIPERVLSLPSRSDGRTIGWTGGRVEMHVGDLEVTHGGIQLALNATDWHFHKVGHQTDITRHLLGLTDRPSETGPLFVRAYHQELTRLDIGIVPLSDTRFNRAKSYLKGLEYAAVGIPFVASPTAAYQELHERGLGILAGDRARNWKSALKPLMESEELRRELGEQYKDIVRAEYTYEGQAWRWAEAWQQAIDNRKAAQ